MSPKAQRIAIAKACGIVTSDQWGPLYKTALGLVRDCPDYLNDLNAMHAAEEVMTEMQRCDYSSHLYDLACKHQKVTEKWRYLSMSAAQRAEALLKTLNLWKE